MTDLDQTLFEGKDQAPHTASPTSSSKWTKKASVPPSKAITRHPKSQAPQEFVSPPTETSPTPLGKKSKVTLTSKITTSKSTVQPRKVSTPRIVLHQTGSENSPTTGRVASLAEDPRVSMRRGSPSLGLLGQGTQLDRSAHSTRHRGRDSSSRRGIELLSYLIIKRLIIKSLQDMREKSQTSANSIFTKTNPHQNMSSPNL